MEKHVRVCSASFGFARSAVAFRLDGWLETSEKREKSKRAVVLSPGTCVLRRVFTSPSVAPFSVSSDKVLDFAAAMAIPISWPSAEDVEDSYRSLDLLLEQLLVTIRQVLVQRRRQQVISTLPIRQRTSAPSATPAATVPTPTPVTSVAPVTPVTPTTPHPRLPLPDLIPDAGDCEAPRARKVRQAQPVPPRAEPPSQWVQAGAELRHIADAFQAERNNSQDKIDVKSARLKDSSLLTLLCPAFGSSLWTTVALLVGWGLFSRTR